MSESPENNLDMVVANFRQALLQCQELYRECARDYLQNHPELVQDSAEGFMTQILDLHRGLVLKVFTEMARTDYRVNAAELHLAQELFEHAWGRRLNDEQAREALRHYAETTHLRWDSLLRPFERLSSFRRRAGELQALVVRLAQLVAQGSGRPESREARQLQWIRTEMQRILLQVPLAGSQPPASRHAVQVQEEDFEIVYPRASRQPSTARTEGTAGPEALAEVLAELDDLIGLESIKNEVRELINFLTIQAERVKHGLPQTPVSLHAVFSGNPGTGKTSVARLFGRILGAMGILKGGHLIETDRSGLVAEYAGQTAPKTNQRIDEALDGVLFIDEAYSLVAEGGEDPYGSEALQVLLKRMEDDRDRLVVILAGYPRPLRDLLRTNPGLSSRFGRTFDFPDYSAVELARIFATMCQRDRYQMPARTRAKLLLGFRYLLHRRDEHFGNGRLARNIFERSVRRLANRLAGIRPLTRELLTTLQPEDLVLEGVPPNCWSGLDSDAYCFQLACPGCRHGNRLPQKLLGQRVKCRQCGAEYQADWGEVEEKAKS
jgi:hypothetical protein